MSYIGAPLVSTNFVLDQFTATAGQTAFTLTRAPASAQSVLVGIDGVVQEPGVAYTVSGTTLTMTSGVPLSSKVWVVHLGVRGTLTAPVDGSVEFASLGSTLSGAVVQSEYAETATRSTVATQIPADDTIPQNTEGDEILTVSITPKSAANLLRVRVKAQVSNNSAGAATCGALFRDSTASAVAARLATITGVSGLHEMAFEHEETAGATSTTTFKLRIGPGSASTAYVNGNASRFFGGVVKTTLVVEEIKA